MKGIKELRKEIEELDSKLGGEYWNSGDYSKVEKYFLYRGQLEILEDVLKIINEICKKKEYEDENWISVDELNEKIKGEKLR